MRNKLYLPRIPYVVFELVKIDIEKSKEEGYKAREQFINQGLPESLWTKIPRDQEIGFLLEEIITKETFGI